MNTDFNTLACAIKARTANAELINLSQIHGTGRRVVHTENGLTRSLAFDREMDMRIVADDQGNPVWWAVHEPTGIQVNVSQWIRTGKITGLGGVSLDSHQVVATELTWAELLELIGRITQRRQPLHVCLTPSDQMQW